MIVTWQKKTMIVAREDLRLMSAEVDEVGVVFDRGQAIFTDAKTDMLYHIPLDWLVSVEED